MALPIANYKVYILYTENTENCGLVSACQYYRSSSLPGLLQKPIDLCFQAVMILEWVQRRGCACFDIIDTSETGLRVDDSIEFI